MSVFTKFKIISKTETFKKFNIKHRCSSPFASFNYGFIELLFSTNMKKIVQTVLVKVKNLNRI